MNLDQDIREAQERVDGFIECSFNKLTAVRKKYWELVEIREELLKMMNSKGEPQMTTSEAIIYALRVIIAAKEMRIIKTQPLKQFKVK